MMCSGLRRWLAAESRTKQGGGYSLPQKGSGKPVFQFRTDICVGLWGTGAMYSGVLSLEEGVLRNLGLRMLGEL